MRLFRTNYVRAVSTDSMFREKLRRLLSGPKALVAGIATAIAIGSFAPTAAMASENEMTDTSNDVTTEQVVDNTAQEISNDDIENVVAEAINQIVNVQETAPVVEAAPVMEQAPSVPETVSVEDTTPIVNESVSDETIVPTVNEDIDNRVPEVNADQEITDEKVESVTDELVNDVQNESVSDETTVPTVNEEIDSIVPKIDMAVLDNTVINDGAKTNSQDSKNDLEQNTKNIIDTVGSEEERKVENKEKADSVYIVGYVKENVGFVDSITSREFVVAENEDGSFTIIDGDKISYKDKQGILDVIDDKISENTIIYEAILPKLTKEDMINNGYTKLFVQIGDYVFTTKDGSVFDVYDRDGRLVYNFDSVNMASNSDDLIVDSNDKNNTTNEFQGLEKDAPVYIAGYEEQNIDNSSGLVDSITSHEFIIAENEDGSFTIIDYRKLSDENRKKIINFITFKYNVTEDVVHEAVLPYVSEEEMVNNGQNEISVQIGDYIFTTKDGLVFDVYDKHGKLINTITKITHNIDENLVNSDSDKEDGIVENQVSTDKNDTISENQVLENNDKIQNNKSVNSVPIVLSSNNNDSKLVKSTYNLQTGDTSFAAALFNGSVGAVLLGFGLLNRKKRKMTSNSVSNDLVDYELFAQNWVENDRLRWVNQRKEKGLLNNILDNYESIAQEWMARKKVKSK